MNADTNPALSAPATEIKTDPILTDPSLPSIWDALREENRRSITFIKPAMGLELYELYTKDTADSPAPKMFAVRELHLRANTCVPFHMDTIREKCYLFQGNGAVIVFLWRKEAKVTKHLLNRPGNQLFVPARMPHALYCTVMDKPYGASTLQIILSAREGVTVWESALSLLLQNDHRGEEI